jgi:hypothetical protein
MLQIDFSLEHWRPIVRFENYEVSDFGRCRSLERIVKSYDRKRNCYAKRHYPGTTLNPVRRYSEYNRVKSLDVTLYMDGERYHRKVHRLVLEAFVGPCPDGMECAHADGDPSNNHLDNLRWATHVENCRDRVLHGTESIGVRNPAAKLDEESVRQIRMMASLFSAVELGDVFGVSKYAIADVLSGNTWSHVE